MKIVGIVFILLGLILSLVAFINYFRSNNAIISPIPDQNGIKVIIVSPSP